MHCLNTLNVELKTITVDIKGTDIGNYAGFLTPFAFGHKG